ncbi:hypothetical protein ACWCQE_27510 [Streptomyces sp. NPDC002409]
MSLQNYSVKEAARLLGCFPRYLEDNLRHLPHQKIGAAVVFDQDELRAIKDMHRVRPAVEPSKTGTGEPSALSLATITPSRGRKRTA